MQYTIKDQDITEEITDLTLDWGALDDEEAEATSDDAGDGLIRSLNHLGRVDIPYISQVTGISEEDVISRLKGAIYQDPDQFRGQFDEGFVTSDEYLSGNLLLKLRSAQKANKVYNGRFTENVDAIISILPAGVSSDDIFYTVSSPWIPDSIKEKFICHAFGAKEAYSALIRHDPITGMWEIPPHFGTYRADLLYGTNRISGSKVMERILNLSSMAIYDYQKVDEKHKKRILNKAETVLVEDKAEHLRTKFIRFVKDNEDVEKALFEAYNAKFGYNVARIYNGSFLTLKGLNPEVRLYDYQKNAIARILLTPNTYLAHNVGAGKTYEMIAGGEELLRCGKSKKNLFVVPNNITQEWHKAYSYLYPESKVLFLEAKEFSSKKWRTTLELIRDTDIPSVIVPYSVFDRMDMSYAYLESAILKRISDIDTLIQDDRKTWTKGLLSAKKKAEGELEALRAKGPSQDEDISFDKLGFTRLFVDEAHNYKNVPFATKMGAVNGINEAGSQKCVHMLDVCDYMNSNPSHGIIMASGTPITNSVTDAYVMQRYLQNGQLKLMDLSLFDNWASMFAENHEELEIDLDTQGYRVNTRFSRFHNLPELTELLAQVTDFYFVKNSEFLPQFNGYSDTVIHKDSSLSMYLKSISDRVDDIRNNVVNRKEDNLLKITMDGRNAALDLRLIDYDLYKNSRCGKVFSCAENIMNDYLATRDFKGTQLVFSDISTPKETFNVYDELKYILVHMGMPQEEIAFIHDATTESAKGKLLESVRKGDVRVLIGSTSKLGTGVNVQDKLYSIHHLSVPWRPADMVQREGRILRQGNGCSQVFIHRYITEESFDAYSWQLLETKQRFINELLSNSLTARSREDITDTVLSYGEVKALAIGNPKLKEHVDVKNQLSRLLMLKKRNEARFALFERELMELPSHIRDEEERVKHLTADLEAYTKNKQEISKEEKQRIRKVVFDSLMDYLNEPEPKELMTYQGFKLVLPDNLIANSLYIRIIGEGTYSVPIGNSEIGALVRIDNYLEGLPDKLQEAEGHVKELMLRRDAINDELTKRPDYSEAIESLSEKLRKLEKELGIDDKQ